MKNADADPDGSLPCDGDHISPNRPPRTSTSEDGAGYGRPKPPKTSPVKGERIDRFLPIDLSQEEPCDDEAADKEKRDNAETAGDDAVKSEMSGHHQAHTDSTQAI